MSMCCGHFRAHAPHETHAEASLGDPVRMADAVMYCEIPVNQPCAYEALYAAKHPGMFTPLGQGMQ